MRQAADQRLRRDQLLRDLVQLLGRQIQQAVAVEERAAIGLTDMREELRLGSHLIGQLARGLFRKIGGASIDDGDKEVVVLRKGLVERPFVLPPRDIARQHALYVGIDREMAGRIDRRRRGEHQARDHDQHCVAAGEFDDAGDAGGDHAVPRYIYFDENIVGVMNKLPRKIRRAVTKWTRLRARLRTIVQVRRGSWTGASTAAVMSRASTSCSPTTSWPRYCAAPGSIRKPFAT